MIYNFSHTISLLSLLYHIYLDHFAMSGQRRLDDYYLPYTIANSEGGCCISDEVFAERCHCTGLNHYVVYGNCIQDQNCRGYVSKINGDLQAITTSSCDFYSTRNCKKFDAGNIGDLDLNATCGKGYTGCTIKRLGKI